MKKMTLSKILQTAATLAFLAVSSPLSAASSAIGTLRITVVDEAGQVVPNAPVYIYDNKNHFVAARESAGSSLFDLKPGEYRVSSALVREVNDPTGGVYKDRYYTEVARAIVNEGDQTSVILPLKPVQSPVASLSRSTLHQIGVTSEVARAFDAN